MLISRKLKLSCNYTFFYYHIIWVSLSYKINFLKELNCTFCSTFDRNNKDSLMKISGIFVVVVFYGNCTKYLFHKVFNKLYKIGPAAAYKGIRRFKITLF